MEVRRVIPSTGIADLFKDLDSRLREQENKPSGNIVIRDTLIASDPVTGVDVVLGRLPDGTIGFDPWVNDVTPPDKPSTPEIASITGTFTLTWDGLDVNGMEQPKDYFRTGVHISEDGLTNWREFDFIRGQGISTIAGEPYAEVRHFRLVSYDQNNNASIPSDIVFLENTSSFDDAELQARLDEVAADLLAAAQAADAANTSAANAQEQADAAMDEALAAIGLANGKGRVLFSTTTPSVEDQSSLNLWIDTTGNSNTPKRWNGSAWVAVTDKTATDAATAAAAANAAILTKTTTYYGTSATGTTIGDLWVDTTLIGGVPGNVLKRWSGSAWVVVTDKKLQDALTNAGTAQATADSKIQTFAQTTAPTGMVAGDVGDIWIDTDDGNKLWRWSGTAWVVVQDTSIAAAATLAGTANTAAAAANQAALDAAGIANNKGKIVYGTTAPTGVDASAFTLWIDTTGGANTPKRWVSGTTWAAVTDKAATDAAAAAIAAQTKADSAFTLANDAQDVAENALADAATANTAAGTANAAALAANGLAASKGRVIYAASAPTGVDANVNNLWIRTSDNKPHTYNTTTTAWVAVTDKAATDAATAATAANNLAASKITTFFGSSATATAVGDLWLDSGNGNTLKRWSGSAWVAVADAKLQEALTAAGDAQATADEKVQTFAQIDPPTGLVATDVGDLWIDTNDGNKMWRWSGSAWVAVQDASIATAKSAADSAAQAAIDAAGIANAKGKVLVQSTAPGVEDRNNVTLWIDTTGGLNTPKRWTSGTTWVAVTDKVAVDAAAAAVAAQSKADLAFNNAALAATAAGNAQTSANGKNRTWYQTTAPAGTGHTDGDMWFDTDDGNKLYLWKGTPTNVWSVFQDSAIGLAQTAANNAATAASVADGKAVAAQTAAGTASTAAATAQSAADLAKANALTADNKAAQALADALAANNLAVSKGKVLYQTSAPTGVDANAQTLWIDTTSNLNTPKRWTTGTTWVAVTDKVATDAASLAATKGKILYQTTAPTGADANLLTLWIDTTGNANTPKKWVSGTTWTSLTDKVASDAAALAATKGKVLFQSTAPTGADASALTLWIDTTGNANTPMKWISGTTWTAITDKAALDAATAAAAAASAATAAQGTANTATTNAATAQSRADQAYNQAVTAATAAGTAQTSANGKSTVWYQDAPPAGTAHRDGDLWFDTDDNNKPSTWKGAPTNAWLSARDATIATAQAKADTAFTTANGKTTTYYQTDQPTGGTYIKGDMWVDTDGGYKLSTYTGTVWQTTQDALVAKSEAIAAAATDAQTKATAAQTAAISAAATDAQTKATNAQTAAISAAALTAQSKADAAQAAAISAAATTAQTKADQAKADAIAAAAITAQLKADGAGQAAIDAAAIDAQTKATAAQAAAIAAAALTAQAKADTAKADAITSAAATAQTKADAAQAAAIAAAAADATSKANIAKAGAISDAATDAQTKATAAQAAAIAAAATDAQSKATAAQAAAIAAAATTAQTKADAAQAAAIAAAAITAQLKADGASQAAIDAAAIDAQTKATNAQNAAVTAAALTAQAKADAAQAAAIAAAATDATNKANAAQDASLIATAKMNAFSGNASFEDWTAATPNGFSAFTTGPVKETTIVRSGKQSAKFDVTASGTQAGLTFSAGVVAGHLPNLEYYTVEVEFYLASGTLTGAGVVLDWTGMTNNRATLNLATEVPVVNLGKWYSVTKVLRRPTNATGTWTGMAGNLMANWTTFGAGVKNITFDWFNIRPSTTEEITSFGQTTAIAAAQTAAATDAQTKATAAQTAAINAAATDAQTKATNAQTAAISAAATAAQTKADAAQAAAIAAAATDAQTKATAAQNAAVASAATAAQTKADAAQAAAISAAATAAQAKADAAQAAAIAAAATDAGTKATNAQTAAIAAAQTKADAAQAAAIAAAATAAQAKADAAQAAAIAAAATDANTKASAAQTAAINAAATDAQTKATAAQAAAIAAAATAAQAKADAAQAAAIAAAATDATNKVATKSAAYYQGTKPTGGTYKKGDIWFDTANGNRSNVHNGTDFVLTQDAAIFAVQPAVTTAIATAANGKNKVVYSTSDASGTGYVAGDTWFKRDGAGTIIAQWEFTTSWQVRTLNESVIAALSAGKITTGTLDADRIGASSIAASKLLISDTTNLVEDAEFLGNGWTRTLGAVSASTLVTTTGLPGLSWKLDGVGTDVSIQTKGYFSVEPGSQYYVSVKSQSQLTGTITSGYVGLLWFTETGAAVSAAPLSVFPVPTSGWSVRGSALTAPATARRATFVLTVTPGSTGGSWWVGMPAVRRMNEGSLIVDGAIKAGSAIIENGAISNAQIANLNADKITAGTIAAARLDAESIKAKVIEASYIQASDIFAPNSVTSASGIFGTVDASVINAGSIAAARLDAEVIRAKVIDATDINAVDIIAQNSITSASGVFGDISATSITSGLLAAGRIDAAVVRAKVIEAAHIDAVDIIATGSITATNSIIGSLDAGVISVGTLSAARLGAKSIGADKVLISSTDNLINEADFKGNGASWDLPTNIVINQTAGRKSLPAMVITNTAALQTSYNSVGIPTKTAIEFTADAGNAYRVSAWVKSTVSIPISGAYVAARFTLSTGGPTIVNTVYVTPGTATPATMPTAGTWYEITGIVVAPVNTVSVAFSVNSAAAFSTGTVTWDMVAVTRASNGELIVDGTITATHMKANTITAASGIIAELDASKITVGSMSGTRIDARSISVSQLLVGSLDNLLSEPQFNGNLISWGGVSAPEYTVDPVGSRTGGTALKIVNNSSQQGRYNSPSFSVEAKAVYRISAWVKSNLAIPANGISLYFKTTTIAGVTTPYRVIDAPATAANTWTPVTATFEIPANVILGAVGIFNQASFASGNIWVDSVSCVRAADGSLIVDGSIDGKLITGATFQTTNLTARGIKLDSLGFAAYDTLGTRTFNIDSATGTIDMTGTLNTQFVEDGGDGEDFISRAKFGTFYWASSSQNATAPGVQFTSIIPGYSDETASIYYAYKTLYLSNYNIDQVSPEDQSFQSELSLAKERGVGAFSGYVKNSDGTEPLFSSSSMSLTPGDEGVSKTEGATNYNNAVLYMMSRYQSAYTTTSETYATGLYTNKDASLGTTPAIDGSAYLLHRKESDNIIRRQIGVNSEEFFLLNTGSSGSTLSSIRGYATGYVDVAGKTRATLRSLDNNQYIEVHSANGITFSGKTTFNSSTVDIGTSTTIVTTGVVKLLTEPTAINDATTKAYVDGKTTTHVSYYTATGSKNSFEAGNQLISSPSYDSSKSTKNLATSATGQLTVTEAGVYGVTYSVGQFTTAGLTTTRPATGRAFMDIGDGSGIAYSRAAIPLEEDQGTGSLAGVYLSAGSVLKFTYLHTNGSITYYRARIWLTKHSS